MTPAQLPRNCPVCGFSYAQAYLQKGALRLVRCRQCSMIYANPVPPQFASGDYYQQAGTDYYLSPAKLESDYAPVRFQRELRLFREYCPTGAVLDVGCSSGAFLFQLNQRFAGCYQTMGTDVSGAPLDYAAAQGVRVVRGNFLESDFEPMKFDAITFWAVLEHLLEPKRFLEHAWTLLRSEGLCFVLVPNMESLAMRCLQARYRYVYPQHLNYFTRATLRQLIQPRFHLLAAGSTHFNPLVLWQDWRRAGRDVSNRERADLLRRTTAYKQNPLLKPLQSIYQVLEQVLGKLNLADNLVVVLRKRGCEATGA